ncbi:MAG TPA: D-alanyl-D-alanine carboxypeptidase/D-alanyl-D-alanine-endopeptidase [Myxococcota bacterium]|nr:D-alanyl-D-alanine carboxypeptidase/D-alanyl-D-alanine-endopeptidase [Myxococcota bacterium]
MRTALAAIALAIAAQPILALDADAALRERLDAALAAKALRGARVSVRVETESGRLLYERGGDVALTPASNQKILTALAALRTFGPAHQFRTEVLADRHPDAQGAVGVLYVRGGGDPALTSEDLWRLAADLRKAGLRRVEEGLVIDDTLFDSERWHPTWGADSPRAYAAPISAFAVNYGAYAVVVSPAATAGDAPSVRIDPPVPYLHVANRARTGPARGRQSLQLDRRPLDDGEEIAVGGAISVGAEPITLNRSVLDPTRYAGAMLQAQLEAVGISVSGEMRLATVPPSAVPLLGFEGAPLSDVVRRFLKYSNNQIGEALVKAMGARSSGGTGTWTNGMAALRAQLQSAGLPLEGTNLVDGSGLSPENRVTPRLLVAALRNARASFEYGAEFEAALPIAGTDGTLHERAEASRARIRAKTGLLTRVTSLSGYAHTADGERIVFSILVNGFRGGAYGAMGAVDGFAAALVRQ